MKRSARTGDLARKRAKRSAKAVAPESIEGVRSVMLQWTPVILASAA
jgi:hypothetical protein